MKPVRYGSSFEELYTQSKLVWAMDTLKVLDNQGYIGIILLEYIQKQPEATASGCF